MNPPFFAKQKFRSYYAKQESDFLLSLKNPNPSPPDSAFPPPASHLTLVHHIYKGL
jgi:hypothetical protein